MTDPAASASDEVPYINGRTRLYGIVGDPIEQVRSPEMVTAELVRTGRNAIVVPLHVRADEFETVVPALMRMPNLDGLIFTIPFKARACALADELGAQASAVGAINAMMRRRDGRWHGDMFDGIGCVEAFRRHGHALAGSRVMLIGAGGAGTAIGVAVARERPAAMRLFDPQEERARDLAERIARVDPGIRVEIGEPSVEGRDRLINASPVGMLADARLPLAVDRLPPDLVVLDAIVKPEITPLLALARESGCAVLLGREMMRGQIGRIVDYFGGGPPA